MNRKLGHRSTIRRTAASALGLALLLTLMGWAAQASSSSKASHEEILRHVRYLASDELVGRGVDTVGIDLAKEYIGREFSRYGLVPGGDNGTYFQGLDVVTGVKVKEPSDFTFHDGSPLVLNEDWTPLGFSHSGAVEAEVVFVGYGITVKEHGYDDYAGVDAKGKIVMVLRNEPPPKDDKSPFRKPPRSSRYAALRFKATNAKEHGAVGMILVDLSPPKEGQKELVPTRRTLGRSDAGLIAVQVTRQIAEKWLGERGISLRQLKEKIDRDERPASASLGGARASLSVSLERISARTYNVIGVVPGSHPQLNAESVVIGAHYDHIGLGYFGTRDASTEGQVHNGADDNASGTALLLNLAQRLSQLHKRPPRTILLVAFTGEELGLYGSRHYVAHPSLPIQSTKAMINLDMVGRLRDNRITVFGIDTAKEFHGYLTDAAWDLGIEARLSNRIGRSDHSPFYGKKIPVLHFFTGSHDDYHRPTDDWDRLNIEGIAKLSDLLLRTVEKIASAESPLAFVPAPPSSSAAIPTSPPPAQDP